MSYTLGSQWQTILDQFMIQSLGKETYPPYNIIKDSDHNYRLEFGVAGFGEDDLSIDVQESILSVASVPKTEPESDEFQYLHRGLAKRNFKLNFKISDDVKVTDASLEDGILTVSLYKKPEDKPKKTSIPINK